MIMADRIKSNDSRKYMLQGQVWVIACCDDQTVLNAIQAAGAVYKFNEHNQKGYWCAQPPAFEQLRIILDASGYSEYLPATPTGQHNAPAQTAYRTTATKTLMQPPPRTTDRTYSIQELSTLIKNCIATSFPKPVWIKGIVTDFKNNGHIYLTMLHYSDNQLETLDTHNTSTTDKLYAVIWSSKYSEFQSRISAGKLRPFKDREAIRVLGKLGYYPARGQMSFYIEEIDETFATEEKLRQREQIRARLISLGIYDRNKTLSEPYLPLRLAVFSNMTAAGNEDFYKNLRRGGYNFEITLFNVTLQGADLEPSFLAAFELLEKIGIQQFDYGIILRGGGSSADLWDFNNLKVAEYIARSNLKFICGIGHEKDTTIIDDISISMSTPSMVCNYLIDKASAVKQTLDESRHKIEDRTVKALEDTANRLNSLSSQCRSMLADHRLYAQQTLSRLQSDLRTATLDMLHAKDTQLRTCNARLRDNVTAHANMQSAMLQDVKFKIASLAFQKRTSEAHDLDALVADIKNITDNRLQAARGLTCQLAAMCAERLQKGSANAEETLAQCARSIKQLSPEAILVRGFAAVSTADGRPVASVEHVKQNDTLIIRLRDGKLRVTIEQIERS